MAKRKTRFFTFLLVLIVCAWAVTPAHAHAILSQADPAANAVLAKSPARVRLTFTESVAPVLSYIHVYDASGQRVDQDDVQVGLGGPSEMTVSLPVLPDGVYTVSWKATSFTDGHLTTGSYPFAIGKVNPASFAANPQTSSASSPLSALLAKWLMILAGAVLTAEIPFLYLVWLPATKNDLPGQVNIEARPAAWKVIYPAALICMLIGIGLSLLAQSGQMTTTPLAAPWSVENYQVLAESRLGLIWLVRLGLMLVSFWLWQAEPAPGRRFAALFVGCALLLSISLTSHAATGSQVLLPVISDWLHLIGMSAWFGGLAYLLITLNSFQKFEPVLRTRLVSLTIQRFSAMALGSVALVGLTGLYAAYLRIGTLQALTTTLYGDSMLAKQAIVGLLMLLAAGNLLVISPRLNRNRREGTSNLPLIRRFTLMVLAEVTLACLLLLSVAYLTYLPPAKATLPDSGLNATTQVDDLQMDLSISPGTIGQNTFSLALNANGQTVDLAKEVLLRFTALNKNLPPSEVKLSYQGNGLYTAPGANLSLPADWQVQAVVRRENKFDSFGNFHFALGASENGSQVDYTPQTAGALLILDGLLFALALASAKGWRTLRLVASAPLTAVLVLGGVMLLVRPPTPPHQPNPVTPTSQSILAGGKVFADHCVACHGEMGMGDGPLSASLNPHPADLMVQGASGVHTDDEIFGWITNGFPGSAMPGFKESIPEIDRWNLVNYIRTLAGQ